MLLTVTKPHSNLGCTPTWRWAGLLLTVRGFMAA
jgi:hypothetical protein